MRFQINSPPFWEFSFGCLLSYFHSLQLEEQKQTGLCTLVRTWSLCFTFKKLILSKLMVSFYIPNDSVWGLVSFTSLPTQDIVRLLTFSHSGGFVMTPIIVLISNYLMTNDAEQYSCGYLPFVSLLQWNAYSSLAKFLKNWAVCLTIV